MSGYSGTPLAKKLGINEGFTVNAIGAPPSYKQLLDPLPAAVRFSKKVDVTVDLVHLFVTERAKLARALGEFRSKLAPDAVVWVSWPKKTAKVPTDVTENTVRELALPLGFVDVKVCAVDDIWSGLKLVVRKELR